VRLDGLALAFGTAVSLATVLAFALLPALRASRVDLVSVLQGGRVTDGAGSRLRRGLVVAQVAVAMALLASAFALGRSVVAALGWSPGFDVHHVAVVSLFAPAEARWTGGQAVAAFEDAAAAVASVPGVASTSLASAGPLFGGTETATVAPFGAPAEDGAAARWYDVSPGHFATLGLPIVAGRDFEPSDGPESREVALVNEALARRLWPGRDPLGQEIAIEGERRVVVGVVHDVPPVAPGGAVMPEAYWPKRQYPRSGTYLVVRSSGSPASLERPLRERLASAAPGLVVGGFRTLGRALERQRVSPRFALALASTSAAVALALAAVGLYGVLAFAVVSRTREIGVRLALGASPARVAADTIGSGLVLVLAGVGLGLPISLAAEHVLAGLVPDLPPGGPAAVAVAAAVFALVSLLAAGLPARRASRLDPAAALRVE
jgi:putative ABC transport system permease protein